MAIPFEVSGLVHFGQPGEKWRAVSTKKNLHAVVDSVVVMGVGVGGSSSLILLSLKFCVTDTVA